MEVVMTTLASPYMLDDLEAVIRRHLRQINSLAEFGLCLLRIDEESA